MRSRAARTVWRSGAPGSTCACARPAGASVAATARRIATRRLTPAQRNTRSFGRPSQERLGAGATSTKSRSSSRRLMLPELHLADWRATKDTLHLYCQMVGKIRMVTVPPRNLFWHGLDLAVSRYSGRSAPPVESDPVTQEAYSREVIACGFWAGDDNLGDAAYYSYTSPEPAGLRDQPLSAGEWIESGTGSLAILPYERVRTAPDPRATLLAFCQSAYEAGSGLGGWDTAGFESAWCPTPSELQDLHASAAATFGRAPRPEGSDP